jgi:glutathione S-transferase
MRVWLSAPPCVPQGWAPQLRASDGKVDDWVEWGLATGPLAKGLAARDAEKLIECVAAMEAALAAPRHYLTGEDLTLADLALAHPARAALGFFGDHEYVRGGWIREERRG